MPIKDLPIFTYYAQQRFKQFNPMDAANFYLIKDKQAKKGGAMYPVAGREHVSVNGINRLDFNAPPRFIYRSIDFAYVIVESDIFRVDSGFNQRRIAAPDLTKTRGDIWFTYLVAPDRTFAVFADGTNMYVYDEKADELQTVNKSTDSFAPARPTYLATFGSRVVCSDGKTPRFYVTSINMDGASFNPSNVFTFNRSGAGQAVFAQERGEIRQMAVLHNTLFMFTDFSVGVWSNTSSTISNSDLVIPFPFRKNTSYDFDYGIADPKSLDVDFGMMVWLGQNRNGIVDVLASNGSKPESISTKAIDVLFERDRITKELSPFLRLDAYGFLYQIDNSIFYRLSAGKFLDGTAEKIDDAQASIEYHFETQTWHRAIELDGKKSLIQQHAYYNNKHLVTVEGDTSVYEMAGDIYVNETRNTGVSKNSSDAYNIEPMRYEVVTQIISEDDYAEFATDWVQIDFAFGENVTSKSESPFANTTFIIDEDDDGNGNPVFLTTEDGEYLITEDSDTPVLTDVTYKNYFRPHIELYYSDDGGVRFYPSDVREFSDLGTFIWRMRWYSLGTSRNRVYKLICVSSSPIVVLGAVHNIRRVSSGAN